MKKSFFIDDLLSSDKKVSRSPSPVHHKERRYALPLRPMFIRKLSGTRPLLTSLPTVPTNLSSEHLMDHTKPFSFPFPSSFPSLIPSSLAGSPHSLRTPHPRTWTNLTQRNPYQRK